MRLGFRSHFSGCTILKLRGDYCGTSKFTPQVILMLLSPLRQSLHFASVKDFEALAYYWQSRLSLLRLEWRLHGLSMSSGVQADSTDELGAPLGQVVDRGPMRYSGL